MPAASMEMAIGMKTTSLNAVAQRMRSVSTAKISPRPVATAGATTIQIRVLLSALRVASLVKRSWKFSRPTKLLPDASKRLRWIEYPIGYTISAPSSSSAGSRKHATAQGRALMTATALAEAMVRVSPAPRQ